MKNIAFVESVTDESGTDHRVRACINGVVLRGEWTSVEERATKQAASIRAMLAAAPSIPDADGQVRQGLSEVTGVAAQIRDMDLKVGETIIGRESGNGYGGYWHEAMLTLLWVGQSEAVWLERTRSDNSPDWSDPEEATDWQLDCREWKRCAHNIQPPKGEA